MLSKNCFILWKNNRKKEKKSKLIELEKEYGQGVTCIIVIEIKGKE